MQRKSENERKKIIERYTESGLSVKVFCLKEGISEQTLRNWIGKAKKNQNRNQMFIEVPTVVEVLSKRKPVQRPEISLGQTHGLLLYFPNDISIEIFPDTDRDTAAWIIEMILRRA